MPVPGSSRLTEVVMMVQVVDQLYLETDGTMTDRRVYVKLPPEVETCGYKLAGIQGVTKCENRTTNFRFNAEIATSALGQEYFPTTPNDLFAYVVLDGEQTQTELTDTTKFRSRYMRINMACSNSSGAARESATVSLWLILIFQT